MPTVYIESREEFIARHCEFVVLDPNSFGQRMLFADGAVWHYGIANEYGQEPPTDPAPLLKLKHVFVSRKLDIATQQLREDCGRIRLQSEIHGSGHGSHPDHQFPGWREHIEKLVKQVEDLQQEVDRLAAELPHNKRRIEYEQRRAAEQYASRQANQDLNQLLQERKTDVRD
jgi:hypothetical protein